jgi:hypothetical protein
MEQRGEELPLKHNKPATARTRRRYRGIGHCLGQADG